MTDCASQAWLSSQSPLPLARTWIFTSFTHSSRLQLCDMSTWLGWTAISGIAFLECLWLRWVQGRSLIRAGAWMKSCGRFVAYTHVLRSVQLNTALGALWSDFFFLLIISSISWLYDNQKEDDPGRVRLKQLEVFHEPRGCKQQQSLQLIIPLLSGPSLLTACLWATSFNLCSGGSSLTSFPVVLGLI